MAGSWRNEARSLVLQRAGGGRQAVTGSLARVGALEEVWEPRERPALGEELGPDGARSPSGAASQPLLPW